MTLTLWTDTSPADWLAHRDLPWARLVSFGPDGFEAYARLRFLPDPDRPGQSENDVVGEDRPDQLPVLWQTLAEATSTPDDCWFCVWEGYGGPAAPVDDGAVRLDDAAEIRAATREGARPGLAPAARHPAEPLPPRVVVPHRAYWLFRGPLADVGAWENARGWPERLRLDTPEPAFVWPDDHAWCLTKDVDPHWAGVGGTRALVDRLVSDPRLDVVPADPEQEQPLYRG